jgi:hypothetical protein
MKFTLIAAKPRNPLATAARQRVAGAHGPSPRAQRAMSRRALQRELQTLDRHRHSP